MLHLYQSNRLEDLAEMMLKLQSLHPLADPLAPEEIVVQSQGMRRYITRFLAQRQGIAANLRFHLPAGLSWRLMREHIGGIPRLSPFSTEVMRWRLLRLFQSPQFARDGDFQAAFSVLGGYLERGPLAAYQLCGELADVFDQYLVYRPDWIEAWSAGRNVADLARQDGDAQNWQASLWRFLDNGLYPVPHRVELWHHLAAALAAPEKRPPERYFVFGIATLAPMYLDLLRQLAQHSEVHILALNPSALFWGDAASPAQILREGGSPDEERQGHPLLASLGKQGRDFFNELAVAEVSRDIASFAPGPASPSLLHSLQWQLQEQILPRRAYREGWPQQHAGYLEGTLFPRLPERAQVFQAALARGADAAAARLAADDSIQIHAAHSPLRELQVLKERLLALLERHPELQPHDIAVLTPDIEPYLPFLEAVFGRYSAFGPPLPYSTADVRRSSREPLLHGLEQVLALLGSRFESERLLGLLDNPLIAARFGIGTADLPLVRETVAGLNIRWGADEAQRADHGGGDKLFTWQQGMERLVLGWLLPQQGGLWEGVSPYDTHPDHTGVLARFAALAALLADTRRLWQEAATVPQWCERVRTLCAALFAEGSAAAQQLEQDLAQWREEAALAQFDLPLDFAAAALHIGRFLGGTSDAGFLSGGITFCGMVPMRSLPFEVLCLIGLNDGAFPRNTPKSAFDLISRHPRKGDRARRDDDRYLFLEALLSARRYLHLSYVGKDIRTDEIRAPSVLLNELADTVAAMSGAPAASLPQHWFVHHPLQAFSERYFSGDPQLSGSRADYAAALNRHRPAPPFLDGAPPEAAPAGAEAAVAQQELIRFWRNPVRSWLQDTLNWQAPYGEAAAETAEPFAAEYSARVERAYIDARRTRRGFAEVEAELSAQSLLPAGRFGDLARADHAAAAARLDAALLDSPALPPQSGTLTLPGGRLDYRLDRLHGCGQLLFARDLAGTAANGRLGGTAKTELLLRHLIACAALPRPVSTHLAGLYVGAELPPLETAEAAAVLSQWLAAYHQGRLRPLPFFPRLNYAAAAAYLKASAKDGAGAWAKAQEAAAQKYHRGYTGFAQEDSPEAALVFGRAEEAPYLDPLFRRLTETLLLPLAEQIRALEQD